VVRVVVKVNKFLGVLVDVGEDGTIKVPMDKLSTAGIRPGGKVEILSNEAYLFLRTVDIFCDVCGTNGQTKKLGKLNLCPYCYENIKLGTEGEQEHEHAD